MTSWTCPACPWTRRSSSRSTTIDPGPWLTSHGLLPARRSRGVAYLIVIAAALVWWRMLEARRGKDSGGQRPRRPASGTGRQAFPRPPSASPRDKLLPGDQGRPHTAEAARGRLLLPLSPVRGHCIGTG